ncbi:MAG TPA: thiamine phosphate synthase [Nitrospirae bacterium]|nr:thiamine phosphate synthase [Nitrospirota bacterium]
MIYLITDRKLFVSEEAFYVALESALKGGIKMLQLREKDLPDRALLQMAIRVRELTSQYGARLFINNRLDIALCVKAEGIHLGQESIPLRAIKKLVGDNMEIAVSTHSIEEALGAQSEDADFITFGPIFDTPSKMKYGKPLGIGLLQEAMKEIHIPIYAIGGIKTDNLRELTKIGSHNIALISGILGAYDVYSKTREYLSILGEKV